MGYMHIDNLYKNQDILLFKECFVLEKVHGTSAHVAWKDGSLRFFSGGEKHDRFVALFDAAFLTENFTLLSHPEVVVYGEAYGGKQQAMRETYGDELRFIAFDVKVGESWLAVPQMDRAAASLGFEVVPWAITTTDLVNLDGHRDAPSDLARRRGCGERIREGVVLRPPIEVIKNNGERIIAKHKTAAFSERASSPKVVDPAKLIVLSEAAAIAEEWVTEMRLNHVLDKIQPSNSIEETRRVISAMTEDVLREAAGEIVDSKEARQAIGKKTAQLFHARIANAMRRTEP